VNTTKVVKRRILEGRKTKSIFKLNVKITDCEGLASMWAPVFDRFCSENPRFVMQPNATEENGLSIVTG
jgi:hypothetical protein